MWNLQELKDTAERELLKQLEKETVVRLLYIGDLFRAEQLFEAALYLTKANISWLRSQVLKCKLLDFHAIKNTDTNTVTTCQYVITLS